MKFDMKSQLIAGQLYHFYARYKNDESNDPFSRMYSHFKLHHLYEWLKECNLIPEYTLEVKKKLNKLARLETLYIHPNWHKYHLEQESIVFYKTYLARMYLLYKLPEKLKIINEDTGKEVVLLSFKAKNV